MGNHPGPPGRRADSLPIEALAGGIDGGGVGEFGRASLSADTPLAGMELYLPGLPSSAKLDISYAGRDAALTDSTSHGGFDNDTKTMNSLLKRRTRSP